MRFPARTQVGATHDCNFYELEFYDSDRQIDRARSGVFDVGDSESYFARLAMVRILIPTRNRPTSLLGVLRYLERFYPGTELLIADGSSDFHKSRNQENVKTFAGTMGIDYRPYPEELPLFDRLLDVVKSEQDEFFLPAADDDFPMLEAFKDAEKYIRAHPECSIAMGALVNVFLLTDVRISARLNPARNILLPTVEARVNAYSRWPVSTTYGVTRRDVLLERYDRARTIGMTGFFDLMVGVHDATKGTMKALPTIGFISTRNYKHSYWRPEEPLFFLHHSERLLKIHEMMVRDFVTCGGMEASLARKLGDTIIERRISEHVGNASHLKPGFSESPLFQNPVTQKQYRMFHDLFTDGTEVRKIYQERLDFIASCLIANTKSQDNCGEKHKYFEIGTVAPVVPENQRS